VTGERSSAVEAALATAVAAGLHVAHPSEDERWTEVICMSCGASFGIESSPSGLVWLPLLRIFVRDHGMHDLGAEDM
jgi:hypothetical protein